MPKDCAQWLKIKARHCEYPAWPDPNVMIWTDEPAPYNIWKGGMTGSTISHVAATGPDLGAVFGQEGPFYEARIQTFLVNADADTLTLRVTTWLSAGLCGKYFVIGPGIELGPPGSAEFKVYFFKVTKWNPYTETPDGVTGPSIIGGPMCWSNGTGCCNPAPTYQSQISDKVLSRCVAYRISARFSLRVSRCAGDNASGGASFAFV